MTSSYNIHYVTLDRIPKSMQHNDLLTSCINRQCYRYLSVDNYPSILHKTQTGTQSGFLNWFGRNGSSSTDLNPCGTTTYEPVHGHMRVFGVGGRELALEPIVIPSL